MSQDCLIGAFDSSNDWETAQREMELRGLTEGNFKLVRDVHDLRALAPHIAMQTDQAKPRLLWGAALGGMLGAVGSFFAMFALGGELAASSAPLGIAVTGAIVGALIGAMSGWGRPRDQEAEIMALLAGRQGVVVRGDPEQLAQAEHALRAADAVAIRYYAAPADSPNRIAEGMDMKEESRPHQAA
ncbi:hypothetical protein [Blastopirellula marina]|uniref:DUF1269 domain-containing protein n=1 Tax=Blastopirellula marina DSM 3645 TaxID=314230 RepID=A3ZS59_9BACT|nr:hypothetical protein [Blastopirellula marina]EAQ80517.1 hypothetical protein DSM3645_14265 [Blastopirellula marina DSM 3645]